MASTGSLRTATRKRREAQHARRQHDPISQAPQVPGGLAPGRGDAIGGPPSHASPSPTPAGGGLASDRGDHVDAGVTSTPVHDTPPPPTTPVHDPPPQNHNTTPPAPPPADSNNNNNQNNNHQTTPQPAQHTTQPPRQQSHPPPTPSHVAPSQNQNTNHVSTTSSAQQHAAPQQPPSSSGHVDPATASQPAQASGAASGASAPSGSDPLAAAAAASATSPASAIDGIVDASTDQDQDASAAAASTKASKLGAGGTAGIVIAIIAILGMLAAFFLYRRRQRAKEARLTRQYGNVRIMSQRYSTGSSFYGIHNVAAAPGGFTTFQDNASTRTGLTTVPPDSPAGGSITYNTPAPAPRAASLLSRGERPDSDDISHYDHDTVDSHGDAVQTSLSYYTTTAVNPFDEMQARMPEYNLPTPPIPAFNSQETILASKASSGNMAYLANSRSAYQRGAGDRKPLNRSVSSQNSFVDDQLRDLYVHNL